MATVKIPFPRVLTAKETLDTLTHWKCGVRNYFRSDDRFAPFFKRTVRWNPSAVNYGLAGDEAESQADNLESLLDTIAGFLPTHYITRKITQESKCMEDVFKIIWKYYKVDPTPATFLDIDSLILEQGERYEDFYYRILHHTEAHMCRAGVKVEDEILPADDKMTTSHKNMVTYIWLNKIHPKLSSIVKLELSDKLKAGTQICTLVDDISENIGLWQHRHGIRATAAATTTATAEPEKSQV